jgi:hypothetical protein
MIEDKDENTVRSLIIKALSSNTPKDGWGEPRQLIPENLDTEILADHYLIYKDKIEYYFMGYKLGEENKKWPTLGCILMMTRTGRSKSPRKVVVFARGLNVQVHLAWEHIIAFLAGLWRRDQL